MKFRSKLHHLKFFSCCRTYATTKKKIPDPDFESKLPIFTYPKSKRGDRRVYVWGLAETGALGVAVPQSSRHKGKNVLSFIKNPTRSGFAERFDVSHVAAGYGFTALAVDTPERWKVFGTGLNTDSQIGYHAPRAGHPLELLLAPAPLALPYSSAATRVTGLAAGRAHLAVLTDTDGVFTLGNNAYGQCGRRVVPGERYAGSAVVHRVPSVGGESIASVCCGQDHTLLVSASGKVYACGWGADGQTGLGHYAHQAAPAAVRGDLASETVVRVASSVDCVLALSERGEVFGWGNSEYGQLGGAGGGGGAQQVCEARSLRGLTAHCGRVVDIAAGGSFCMLLNEEGEVFVWGYGLLGLGPHARHAATPTRVPPALFGRNEFNPHARVVRVAAGAAHAAAVTATGELYAWGRNAHGCLGLGHERDQGFPLRVALGAAVLRVACGVDHTVAFCKPFV